MAWELRRGRRYYYRSVRVGSHVRKQYFGTGEAALLALNHASQQRQNKLKAAQALAALQAMLIQLDHISDELEAGCDLLTQAALMVAGYHRRNRGAWRRKRDRKSNATPGHTRGRGEA